MDTTKWDSPEARIANSAYFKHVNECKECHYPKNCPVGEELWKKNLEASGPGPITQLFGQFFNIKPSPKQ